MIPHYTFGTTHGLALNSDGTLLAAVGPSHASIFATNTGTIHTNLEPPIGHAYDVDFSPTGESVVVCFHGGHVRRYDVSTGAILTTYEGHSGVPNGVRKVQFSPNGALLASVSEDNTLRIWDVISGEQRTMFKGRADINSVVWGPDQDELLFATDVGIGLVHKDTRKGRARDTGPIAEIHIFQNRIYAEWHGSIKAMDHNLDTAFELPQAHVSRLRGFRKNKLFAASWTGDDVGVHCFDLTQHKRHRLQNAPTNPVWALALDPKQEMLYIGCTSRSTSDTGIVCVSIAHL